MGKRSDKHITYQPHAHKIKHLITHRAQPTSTVGDVKLNTANTDDTLEVAEQLATFVQDELAGGSHAQAEEFWEKLSAVLAQYQPQIEECLQQRQHLQTQIDAWLLDKSNQPSEVEPFLRSIGYLVDNPTPTQVTTSGVDPEIAHIAGPQLVVPVDNARYALNAANARWGSLYDAFYGTDALPIDAPGAPGTQDSAAYNPARGQKVIAHVRTLLDEHFPLAHGTHADTTAYFVAEGNLQASTEDGSTTALAKQSQFIGYTGNQSAPQTVLLQKHGLHLELLIDPQHNIGKTDKAGIADVRLESAVSTIMDLEDSVSAVDAADKVAAYANWLGLMAANLTATFTKGDDTINRRLNPDTSAINAAGQPITIKRRSLMLVRCVGLHMQTDMVRLNNKPMPETIVDVAIAAWCAQAALGTSQALDTLQNSRSGSIYLVMPKLHGPSEVALVVELLASIESLLGLAPNTIKMGIMDEERRTSVNLAACIAAASERVVFINTGFLDRTGDDIHTQMEAGPVLPKAEIKSSGWLNAYENANVAVGLAMGLPGHAQIGKGMWARPDDMAAMLAEKSTHPRSGATTAWVPSPVAATLHALHYLATDVRAHQIELAGTPHNRNAALQAMLTPALLPSDRQLSPAEVQRELENNVQGILGYVTRWVGQGVGCSKVPDIDNVALMEDRATLRISSQHIANWLHHGLLSEEQVRSTMQQMASVVDAQNASDPDYQPMTNDLATSIPFAAALELVFTGRTQPCGYTEPTLTAHRRRQKDLQN